MKEIKDYLHLYLGCRVRKGNEVNSYKLGYGEMHAIEAFGYWDIVRPFLRPLSDISEQEAKVVCEMANINYSQENEGAFYDLEGFKSEVDVLLQYNLDSWQITRYLLSKHFDLFGLIQADLALPLHTIKTKYDK